MRPRMAYNSQGRGASCDTLLLPLLISVRTNEKPNLLIELYDASMHKVSFDDPDTLESQDYK